MDNCVRENKNKYVLGFLSLLVEKNIFTEVRKIMYSVHFNFYCDSHYNSLTPSQFLGLSTIGTLKYCCTNFNYFSDTTQYYYSDTNDVILL